MEAKHPGKCAYTGLEIHIGDEIVKTDAGFVLEQYSTPNTFFEFHKTKMGVTSRKAMQRLSTGSGTVDDIHLAISGYRRDRALGQLPEQGGKLWSEYINA